MHSFAVCWTVFCAKLISTSPSLYISMRHTFATRTLKAGVPISVVSKWLGHANISTTYNTYIHVLCSEEKDASGIAEGYVNTLVSSWCHGKSVERQFVRYIVKIGEKERNRMVSPFFCSVDCFPLTAPAPALRRRSTSRSSHAPPSPAMP